MIGWNYTENGRVAMNKEEFQDIVAQVKATGLEYKEYPNNYLINVTDVDGVVQSFYSSTGTAIFRDGNDKYKQKRHSEYNMTVERFLDLCNGKEDILEAFFSD